ncbi:nitroreductase family protein [Halobacillus shinanisalinarum]|uniref:Nitroreductase family protein n=1 Tax=Halobacillus shinanisalinarum TaxID=2932258 RepID=A0ABY4H473_9BACI|nr:nitroreductase family protein [Halobacillus shinanisalinarum]
MVATNLDVATDHYGERGYRFSLMEAGHMVQNMMLVAGCLGKVIAPIGGFDDHKVNGNILPDEDHLSALYIVPVGLEI